MTFAEMVERTRRYLGDYSSDTSYTSQYDIAWVKSCVNEAALQVAKETLSLRTYHDQPTVVNQQQYALRPDFLSLKRVDLVISSSRSERLERKGGDQFEDLMYSRLNLSGEPNFFKVEFGATRLDNPAPGDIWLGPIPSSASWILRVTYFQAPTVMSDDADICELNKALHKAVCYQAVTDASREYDDYKRAELYTVLYDRDMAMNSTLAHEQDRVGAKFGKNPYAKNRGAGGRGGLPRWDTTNKTVT